MSDPAEELSEAAGSIDIDMPDAEAGAEMGEGMEATEMGEPTQSLTDRLMSTQPDTPLEQVEAPWNPEQGGVARIYRGVQKMGAVDGMPAVADMLIGVMELMHTSDLGPSSEDDGGDGGGEWVMPNESGGQ